MNRVAFLLVVSAGLSGCESLGLGRACTDEPVAGIMLTVVDSASGEQLEFGEVTVLVRDGTYRDSVSIPESGAPAVFLLASDRPGTYEVSVTADEYEDWASGSVVVVEDACHVRTVEVLARLQPAAS